MRQVKAKRLRNQIYGDMALDRGQNRTRWRRLIGWGYLREERQDAELRRKYRRAKKQARS